MILRNESIQIFAFRGGPSVDPFSDIFILSDGSSIFQRMFGVIK